MSSPYKNNSKVLRANDYKWDSVERKEYKTETTNFKDITRHSLLGEQDDEYQLNSQTRYFEIGPGGYSSLEYHRHPHSVVVIRGSGTVVLNDRVQEIGLHDVIFVSPETVHQFHADNGDHLGFLCVVDRYRDKPTIPGEEIIDAKVGQGEAREKIRF